LIVGAGPTGLVLALSLTRLGIAVRIVDKASDAGTSSRALGVHARTLEFYRQFGIADAVVSHGIEAPGVNLWVEGIRAARVPLSRIGQGQTAFPFILIYPQDVHERLLIEKLAEAGVTVERSTELMSFEQDGLCVRSLLRHPDGSTEEFESRYLAGCDGASSAVRRALTSRFPGGTYSHVFYVADVEARGPAVDNEVHIDLGKAEFLGIFPLTDKGHVRVIGSVPDDLLAANGRLTLDAVRGDALASMRLEVTRENWFSTYHVHHRVAERFRWGRAFLLGDAAHVHSPVGAQGMNTGIGDAVNLAWKMASVLDAGAPDSLLDTYEAERIAFARKLVSTTDRIFTLATRRGAVAEFIRTKVLPRLIPTALGIAAVGRALFRTMSQIGIQYRKSPLSTGRAGAVHGGDRLPWLALGSGQDNYASIDGLGWTVHVYGEVPPGIVAACEELGLPLHAYPWEAEMGTAGLVPGALLVLRPDGYVGLAEARCSTIRLYDYFRDRRLDVSLQQLSAVAPRGPA
jgi:2-polyprenyl-6-methoxyphenol hydroxylase-like FAD-dependent oxidoreductase